MFPVQAEEDSARLAQTAMTSARLLGRDRHAEELLRRPIFLLKVGQFIGRANGERASSNKRILIIGQPSCRG